MKLNYEGIDDILENLNSILSGFEGFPINEEKFTILCGKFTQKLNDILKQYHKLESIEDKHENAPYINFYRQIHHYLAFILRFPTILLIPGHSEIEQLLDLIRNKERLIETKYKKISEDKFALFEDAFRNCLEGAYLKRIKLREKSDNHS